MMDISKKIILNILSLAVMLLIFSSARAQRSGLALLVPSRIEGNRVEGPQLMITWHAKTYTPAWFKGKTLPTANSSISASVELVDSKGLVNLSGQQIYWYANDQLMGGGVGLQGISFNAPSVPDNIIDLRIEIPSYGSDQTSPVLKTIEIPVVNPEAVVESPFPNGEFHSIPIELRGWPFFFNAEPRKLNFSWSVNGESSQNSENPEVLAVNLNSDAPSGSGINAGLTIRVPGSTSNVAMGGANLTFIK